MLYRKYRPKAFSGVLGQPNIVRTLLNASANGRIAHAYLLAGPKGSGKTTLARLLAKAANCTNKKDGEVCSACDACKAIDAGSALDVIEIDAASHTQVEKIRELLEKVRFAPTDLLSKVYIIDEVHMLSGSSFNALLKTLEEPPAHMIFIMATTDPAKLPETVTSRTQRFDLARISSEVIKDNLINIAKQEKLVLDAPAAGSIAASAAGSMRDALASLEQLITFSAGGEINKSVVLEILGIPEPESVASFLTAVLAGDAKTALGLLRDVVAKNANITEFIKASINILRGALVANIEGKADVNGITGEFAVLAALLEDLQNAGYELRRAVVPEAAVEKIIFKYRTAKAMPMPVAAAPAKKAMPSGGSDFSWNELLLDIKSRNNSIYAFVKGAEYRIGDDELTLLFDYKFHKEKIAESRNSAVIEASCERVLGKKMRVVCELRTLPKAVQDQAPVIEEVKEDLLDAALEIIGGEVVDES